MLVREALAIGDVEVAEQLRADLARRHRLDEIARSSAAAAIDEARGDLRAATGAYETAATSWWAYGDRPEHAYALLGKARCLRGLGLEHADAAAACAAAFRAAGMAGPEELAPAHAEIPR
jgi:hypothetical protein